MLHHYYKLAEFIVNIQHVTMTWQSSKDKKALGNYSVDLSIFLNHISNENIYIQVYRSYFIYQLI